MSRHNNFIPSLPYPAMDASKSYKFLILKNYPESRYCEVRERDSNPLAKILEKIGLKKETL